MKIKEEMIKEFNEKNNQYMMINEEKKSLDMEIKNQKEMINSKKNLIEKIKDDIKEIEKKMKFDNIDIIDENLTLDIEIKKEIEEKAKEEV